MNKSTSILERDFQHALSLFPKLRLSKSKNQTFWVIRGDLDICDSKGHYWETFGIKVFVPVNYPFCIPFVRELSAIIPRDNDWHMGGDGTCCLDIPHRLQYMSRKGIHLVAFLSQKVVPFFANFLYRRVEKKYAGAEYAHSFDGIKQFYEEDLNLSVTQAKVFIQSIFSSNTSGRNELCLCGSGKKMKKCHLYSYHFLKSINRKQIEVDLAHFEKINI